MAVAHTRDQEDLSNQMIEDQRQDNQDCKHGSPVPGATTERGKIYIEGRVKDNFAGDLEQIRSEIVRIFHMEIVQNLSLVLWQEMLESDAFKGLFPEQLLSLKAVEHVRPSAVRRVSSESLQIPNFHEHEGTQFPSTYFPIKSIDSEVYVYQMSSNLEHLEDNGRLLQVEIIQLPSVGFEGIWERLVFNTDTRGNIIRLMINIIKFSRALSNANFRPRTNRLILFSGPPGTGKTTLCQALAQKLSIRLNRIYSSISLIQINAASLLSKFFSESAKHILQIFNAILSHCTSSPSHFIIVLIDEIESLASSRHAASARGEVQDTIRATNALLTGFDKVRSQPNLIILCTSNMVDTLDAAFLDRCGHRIVIEEPSKAARYQILRDGIQELIAAGIINSRQTEETDQAKQIELGVPSFRDAQLELLSEPKKPGSVLMKLCALLDPSTSHRRYGVEGRGRSSARYLSQLPEIALADRLITESCSLGEALQHMVMFVEGQIRLDMDQKDAHAQAELGGSENL